jgi:tRNA1Val (adenine37-N6)-methyltransferase
MQQQLDFLTTSGVQIRQHPSVPNFTGDAIALANFAKCKSTDTVIDIGCGTGVISLILNDTHKPARIIAVDICEHAATLTAQNFALNNMTNAQVHHADIREFYKTVKSNIADVIVCNPPYFATGRTSPTKSRATARHSQTLTLPDLCTAATRLVRYGGFLYICYPLDQIAYAIQTLENHSFRIKELKLTAHLALIKSKKSNSNPSTKVTWR